MFAKGSRIAAAIGGFLAGGVIVGGFAFASSALGAGAGVAAKGQSSAEYTAKNAWMQEIPGDSQEHSLTIPSGDRLTVTNAFGDNGGCSVNASVNGQTTAFTILPNVSSTGATNSFTFYADSGTVNCESNAATLVGFVTPMG